MGVINYFKRTYYRTKVTSPSRVLGLRPARQHRQTCWLYSVTNLIRHSKILKGNIAYAVHSTNKLKKQMNNLVKSEPNYFKNTNTNIRMNFHGCRMRNIHLRTLKNIAKERINNRKLANFAIRVHNKNNSNIHILNRGGNELVAFEKVLKLFGIIPESCIEYSATPGYKLEGALINVYPTNKNKLGHALTGTFDRFGRPYVIDSDYGKAIRVDWRKQTFFNNYFKIYHGSKMFNSGMNIPGRVTKIYVKKLY